MSTWRFSSSVVPKVCTIPYYNTTAVKRLLGSDQVLPLLHKAQGAHHQILLHHCSGVSMHPVLGMASPSRPQQTMISYFGRAELYARVYGIGYINRSLEKTCPLYLVFTLSSIALNVSWWELNENVHYIRVSSELRL